MTYKEEQHLRDLELIKNFRLIDDDFMKKVFEDKACTQELLRIIMEKDDLTVIDVQTEYELHNLWGRSVRIDVYAEDSTGKRYDIEIQRADKGAGEKRARYNSSMLDANELKKAIDFSALSETYVIFITENDVLKKNLPIYHIDRVIRETGEIFDDKAHIIYVNNQITDNTPLGRLMQDFQCSESGKIKNKIIAERVKYFKEEDEGVRGMCKAIEDMRIESENRGIAIGKEEGIAIGAIRAYMGMGLGFEQIVKLLCENLSYTLADAENLTKEYFK